MLVVGDPSIAKFLQRIFGIEVVGGHDILGAMLLWMRKRNSNMEEAGVSVLITQLAAEVLLSDCVEAAGCYTIFRGESRPKYAADLCRTV